MKEERGQTAAPWPGSPQAGIAQLTFEGLPGHKYFFTAQAGDLAGNWTVLTDYSQAATRIVGPRSSSGPDDRRVGPRKYAVGFTPL